MDELARERSRSDRSRSGPREPFVFAHPRRGLARPARPLERVGPGGLPTRSLADTRPGDVVKVADIFFQIVRDRCWELGIDRGEVFECRGTRDDHVVLEHDELGRLELETHYARFVSTVSVASGLEVARS